MQRSFLIPAVLCTVAGNAVASPADSPDALHATLTQAEVIRLAKTVAKQEKGKTLDTYDLKSLTFDPTNREWTVSFDPKPPRHASEECFLVIVKDDTRETKVLRCG